MSTTLRLQPTHKAPSLLVTGNVRTRRHVAVPHAQAVIDAVAACEGAVSGWRKADLLRGRGQYVHSLFALGQELKDNGATVVELECVGTALYDGWRAIATEGLVLDDATFMEALQAEQVAEGAENNATLAYLAHQSLGTLDALIAAHLAEMERTRRIIELAHAKRTHMLEGTR